MRRLSAIILALAFLFVTTSAQAVPDKAIKVHNIDVGQGSATLIQTMNGKNILVDTGWDFAGDRLNHYLKKIGVKRLDAMVISHRHMDHIGAVKNVAEKFPVDKLIGPWSKEAIPTSVMAHVGHLRKDMKKPISAKNRPAYEMASTGKVFDFGGGFKMETLWPKVHASGKAIADYNEESVAMRVTQSIPGKRGAKAASFLVGGDLGVAEERWVARKMPGKLKVDWMVANHHGSKGSSQREYMVSANGDYSRMLKALIDGPTSKDKFVHKTARAFYDEVKTGKYAATLLKNLDPLYKPAKPLIEGSRLDKTIKGMKQIQKWETENGRPPKYAIYSAGPNSYGHPNAARLAEAALAGFTPITTWANGASVVMTRSVGSDGNWKKEGWVPSKVSSKGMPFMRMPAWLAHQDKAKPYNNDRREGTGHWQKNNPQPEVSWTAEWDHTKSWRTVARANAKGRKAWVEEYVDTKKQAEAGDKTAARKLKSMQHKGKEWHGLDIKNWQELTKDQLKALVRGKLDRSTLKGKGDVKDPVSAKHTGLDRFKQNFTDERGQPTNPGATTFKAPTTTTRKPATAATRKPATAATRKPATAAKKPAKSTSTLAKYGSTLKKTKTAKPKAKTTAKPKAKTTAKKATTKKAPVKKATTKKAPVRTAKTTTKKATPRKKTTTNKATTRTKTKVRTPVRQRPTRKSTTRRTTSKRTSVSSRSSFGKKTSRR